MISRGLIVDIFAGSGASMGIERNIGGYRRKRAESEQAGGAA